MKEYHTKKIVRSQKLNKKRRLEKELRQIYEDIDQLEKRIVELGHDPHKNWEEEKLQREFKKLQEKENRRQ